MSNQQLDREYDERNSIPKTNNNIGEAIIALLSLTRSDYGRVDTIIGTKTAVGLAKTIQRIMDDKSFAKELIKDAHHG